MTGPLSFLNFTGIKRLPVIMQTEAAECGLACLAMILAYHRYHTDLGTLRRVYSVSLKGTTLRELIDLASVLDISCRPIRFSMSDLRFLSLPAILHWDMCHFVVLSKVTARGVIVHDPAFGRRHLSMHQAADHITGVALEAVPTPAFRPQRKVEQVRLSDLWNRVHGLKSALIQTLLLSSILQLVALASPFYLQLAIDEALLKEDREFLLLIAIGFAGLVVIHVATATLRLYIIAYLSNRVGYQLTINLFRHLLRLPLAFFERRHLGDIVSRFSSTTKINDAISFGLVSALIDGTMSIAILAMMFVYDTTLAWVVVVTILVYALFRCVVFWPTRQRNHELIAMTAKENSYFMESVRAIMSIKMFSGETVREQSWHNHLANKVNANARVQVIRIYPYVFELFIFGLQHVLIIYLGVQFILEGRLTVGMLFAFIGYRQFFQDRVIAFSYHVFELKMLALHLDRLADIIRSQPELAANNNAAVAAVLQGGLELRGVGFRYSEGEDYIFRDLSMTIRAGEMLAITGRSGCGKTTLLKVILGLLPADEGEILIDGAPLNVFGVQNFRRQISAVMQDDQLLSGTLADNICFFDPEFDMARIEACARTACIHDDIIAMPMNYNSLVGDMGTTLSGGQKQRVLLARALYKRPAILFMDEGTAHLDTGTEEKINLQLKAMEITRVIIAHRQETIRAADRVIDLDDNQLRDITDAVRRLAAAGTELPGTKM